MDLPDPLTVHVRGGVFEASKLSTGPSSAILKDSVYVITSIFLLMIGTLRAVFLSQADLVLENFALRQQLAVFARNRQRPGIVAADGLFWLALRSGRLWKSVSSEVYPTKRTCSA